MSARHLLILACSDHLMWYASRVGQLVPMVDGLLPEPNCYWSREPSGLVNIVRQIDAAPTPAGWAPAANDTLIQPGDLIADIHSPQGPWRAASLAEIGSPAHTHTIIRRTA